MTPLSVAELTVASAARDARLQADARAAEREWLRVRVDGLISFGDYRGLGLVSRDSVLALLSDSKEATE